MYQGTRWDWSFYIGTMGLFLTAFYLFVRVLPMIAIFEMRMLLPGAIRTRRRSMRPACRLTSRSGESGLPTAADEAYTDD